MLGLFLIQNNHSFRNTNWNTRKWVDRFLVSFIWLNSGIGTHIIWTNRGIDKCAFCCTVTSSRKSCPIFLCINTRHQGLVILRRSPRRNQSPGASHSLLVYYTHGQNRLVRQPPWICRLMKIGWIELRPSFPLELQLILKAYAHPKLGMFCLDCLWRKHNHLDAMRLRRKNHDDLPQLKLPAQMKRHAIKIN